jgi:hypothetical protein
MVKKAGLSLIFRSNETQFFPYKFILCLIISSTCRFVNSPFCQHFFLYCHYAIFINWIICPIVILSSCQFVNFPFCLLDIMLILHSTWNFINSIILSNYHFVKLPICQFSILSTCHFVKLPFLYLALLSTCHLVILTVCHVAI